MATLKLNSTGPDVLKVTAALVRRGFLKTETELFDKTVQNAVKLFQASHTDPQDRPLVVDGTVGPLTLWSLDHDDISNVIPAQSIPPHPAGTGYGDMVVKVALEEMAAGAREIGSNNSGPFVKKYMNGLAAEGNSWCAAFNSYCNKVASERMGIPMPFKYDLGAKDTYSQFKKKGWSYKASDDNPPMPGDIIVWTRGDPNSELGHIGIVYKYDAGILTTIEGNKGAFDAPVRTFTYTLSSIANLYGFGRAVV